MKFPKASRRDAEGFPIIPKACRRYVEGCEYANVAFGNVSGTLRCPSGDGALSTFDFAGLIGHETIQTLHIASGKCEWHSVSGRHDNDRYRNAPGIFLDSIRCFRNHFRYFPVFTYFLWSLSKRGRGVSFYHVTYSRISLSRTRISRILRILSSLSELKNTF